MNKALIVIVVLIIGIAISLIPVDVPKTVSVPKTEYVTVYETRYDGELRDLGLFGITLKSYNFYDAQSYEFTYTGVDAAGYKEYTVEVYYPSGEVYYYYDINWWDIKPKQVPVTKTQTVYEYQTVYEEQTVYEKQIVYEKKPFILAIFT